MDYCTLEEVRTELVKQGATAVDDNAIVERIPRACAVLDRTCRHILSGGRRAFSDESVTSEIRRGSQMASADDGALVVTVAKGYCQSVTSAEYSTDLKVWHALPLDQLDIDQYTLTFLDVDAPRNVRLFARLSYQGGYAVLPDDLVYCAVRIAAFMYHEREAPFGVIAFPEAGQVVVNGVAQGNVLKDLKPYMRVTP